jgi:hypothetical protein
MNINAGFGEYGKHLYLTCKMKKNYFYLLTTLLVAMMSFGLTACGDDDDDDSGSGGGGGNGNGVAVVDGTRTAFGYGYYKIRKYSDLSSLSIDFYDFDANLWKPSSTSLNGKTLANVHLAIEELKSSDIQPGTYAADMELYSIRVKDISKVDVDEESAFEYLPAALGGYVEITISGTPDNWTISIPETTVEKFDAYTEKHLGTATFSFNFTGKLVKGNPIRDDDGGDDDYGNADNGSASDDNGNANNGNANNGNAVDTYTLHCTISDYGTMSEEYAAILKQGLEANFKQTISNVSLEVIKAELDQAVEDAVKSGNYSDSPYNYTIEFYITDSKGNKVYSRYIMVKNGKATAK